MSSEAKKYKVVEGQIVDAPDGRAIGVAIDPVEAKDFANELNRLASERDAALSDIANAVKCAKEYCPDYPWTLNTASEAVWATGEAFAGVSRACDDLVSERESLTAQRDAAVEALAKIARVVETVTDADFAGSSTLAWGRVRGIVEAAMAATPAPAPTVNAELLAACKALLPFAANGHATGESLAEIVRPNRAIAQAKAAIASAEKH